MADSLKPRSAVITDGPDRAPTRAMLKAAGFSDEDLRRPIIGVANTWIEIGPCNYHLRRLAVKVKEGIRAAGGTPMEFNTVSISDGISMGVEGMKCSLISREVIADSIELVARGNHFDGLVCLSGCDKTNPGVVMALARLDIPGLALYGGSIAPGHLGDKDLTIQDVFEAVGAYASKRIDAEQLLAVENAACPGAGACGGQFTANTMSTVMEFLGISPMGSNGIPATLAEKDEAAFNAGKLVMDLLKRDLRPSKILTRKSIENAIASVAATGGSTNAVLHLLAIAREAGVELNIDDFDKISDRTPLIADLKPGGRFVASDLYHAGGIQLVAKRLIDAGLIHGDTITVTGKTLAEAAEMTKETAGQEVVRAVNDPLKATGGLVILKGNLAPEGCVVKVAGHERMIHRGPARVFDREEDAFAAVQAGKIKDNDVVVIRYEGPEGRTGNARDARRHRGARRRGLGRCRRVDHRWPLLRGDPWTDGGACCAGSRPRRPHRRAARWRFDSFRHQGAPLGRGDFRTRIAIALKHMESAGAALQDRRHGQICQARVVGVGRRGDAVA